MGGLTGGLKRTKTPGVGKRNSCACIRGILNPLDIKHIITNIQMNFIIDMGLYGVFISLSKHLPLFKVFTINR